MSGDETYFIVRAGPGKGVATHIAARLAATTLCGLVAGRRGGGIFELNSCRRNAHRDGITAVIGADDRRENRGREGLLRSIAGI